MCETGTLMPALGAVRHLAAGSSVFVGPLARIISLPDRALHARRHLETQLVKRSIEQGP